MTLALEILGLIFMSLVILLSIWGFILINKLLIQVKYKNYLLEKISDEISIIVKKSSVYKNGD